MALLNSALVWLAVRLDHYAGLVKSAAGWRRWLIAFAAGVSAALAMAPVYALPLLAAGLSAFVLLIVRRRMRAPAAALL